MFGNRDEKIGYIRGFFDGEGTVTGLTKGSHKGSRRVAASNTDYGIIKFIKKLLNDLGIRARIYKRNRPQPIHWKQGWDIVIFGKENIEKYAEIIGFAIKSKEKKLAKIIKSYKEQKVPPTKKEVKLRYLSQNLSYTELTKIWGYKSVGSIGMLLKKYNIKARSYSDASKLSWGKRKNNRLEGQYAHVTI